MKSRPPNLEPPSSLRARSRVVVVDDDPVLVEIYTLALSPHFQVKGFCQPGEALDYLRSQGADLLVTDYTMPGLDGLELVRRVKEVAPGIKVVLISGTTTMVLNQSHGSLPEMVDHFLPKPFGLVELLEKCRCMFQGPDNGQRA